MFLLWHVLTRRRVAGNERCARKTVSFWSFFEIADWKLDFLEAVDRIGVLNAFKIIPTLFSMLCAFWQSSLLCQPPGPLLVSILRLVFLDAAFTRWQSRLLSSLFSRLLVGYFVTRHQKKEKGRAEKPDASTISFLALFLECLFCGCSHILCSCFDPPSTVCSASLLVFSFVFPSCLPSCIPYSLPWYPLLGVLMAAWLQTTSF